MSERECFAIVDFDVVCRINVKWKMQYQSSGVFFQSTLLKVYPGHLPTSKMKTFVTIAIAAKSSMSNVGRGPGHDSILYLGWKSAINFNDNKSHAELPRQCWRFVTIPKTFAVRHWNTVMISISKVTLILLTSWYFSC